MVEKPISALAAQMLLAKGYQEVKEIDGGYTSWLKNGYPVTPRSP
jgi:rhodanese-related sulfurtransferase